jgi:hypothetical protein
MAKNPVEEVTEELPQAGHCRQETHVCADLPGDVLKITHGFCGRNTGGHRTTCIAHRQDRTTAEDEALARVVADMLEAGDSRFQSFVFPVGFGGFRGRVISEDAAFTKTVFLGDADFAGSRFSGEVSFTDARISGQALFSSSTATGALRFTASEIGGDAHFEAVSVEGDLDFTVARIHGSVLLDKAKITGRADLMQAAIGGSVSMNDAHFLGDVILTTADIRGNLTAIGASFARVPVFDGTVIGGEIRIRPMNTSVDGTRQATNRRERRSNDRR